MLSGNIYSIRNCYFCVFNSPQNMFPWSLIYFLNCNYFLLFPRCAPIWQPVSVLLVGQGRIAPRKLKAGIQPWFHLTRILETLLHFHQERIQDQLNLTLMSVSDFKWFYKYVFSLKPPKVGLILQALKPFHIFSIWRVIQTI